MSFASLAKTVKLAHDLTDRRDDMKVLLGPAYGWQTAKARQIIQVVADANGLDLAAAALKVATEASEAGQDMAANLVFAALVDLCEEADRGEA
jgi:hypothetical protein